MSNQSGPNSGGDLFDMAEEGTRVPEDAAKPRYIPSKPRPDEIASETDPNNLGGRNLAEAATNAGDIPRVSYQKCRTTCTDHLQTTRDVDTNEVLTGTGDALPSQVDSKRLHNVPGGVTNDPAAKGSIRYTKHKAQESEFETGASEGAQVDAAPGDEELSPEEAMDKTERREL